MERNQEAKPFFPDDPNAPKVNIIYICLHQNHVWMRNTEIIIKKKKTHCRENWFCTKQRKHFGVDRTRARQHYLLSQNACNTRSDCISHSHLIDAITGQNPILLIAISKFPEFSDNPIFLLYIPHTTHSKWRFRRGYSHVATHHAIFAMPANIRVTLGNLE